MSLDNLPLEPVHIAGVISLGVFLCAIAVARLALGRGLVRGRIARSNSADSGWSSGSSGRSLTDYETASVQSLLSRIGALVQPRSAATTTALRRQLLQAGYFSAASVSIFHGIRVACGVGLAVLLPALEAFLEIDLLGAMLPLMSIGLGAAGLILPGVWLDHRRAAMRVSYRNAFPDFMDLVVVCVEAGQSLHGAIDRVSREIVQFSPALGANLHIVNLELRAGRTLVEALDALHDRVGIDEVKSLQVLLKQSEELGSSIAGTLRVFSDEMREKRMSRAEAKAYSLPVKMTVPLGLFIFPVILLVILVPIIIRVRVALLPVGV